MKALELAAPDLQQVLRIIEEATSEANPVDGARQVMQAIQAWVPFAAAAVSAWEPASGEHVTVASEAYPDWVLDHLNHGFIAGDPAYQLMRYVEPVPFRMRDTPFDYFETYSYLEVFHPAGYDEGMSMPLFTPEGRYTGVFHVSTESRRDPSDTARAVVFHLQRALATVVDALRRPAWLASSLPPTMHAAAISPAGAVFELGSRVPGPLLQPESPLVALAAGLLRQGRRDRRCFWRDPQSLWHRMLLIPVDGLAVVGEEPCQLPHELTARELDILTLLSTGRSNAEIATTLVISPRTVGTHVEHVMAKLGCPTRAACAARAAGEGLLREPPPGVAPAWG